MKPSRVNNRLRSERDALAAEGRVMLTALRNVWSALDSGAPYTVASLRLFDPNLNVPHTAREVERLKKLEAVEKAARQRVGFPMDFVGRSEQFIAQARYLEQNLIDAIAAFDAWKGEG